MKVKPIITDRIKTTHTNFHVDIRMEYNITFIQGDSGVGKSAVYSFIEELATEDKRIRCINYLDINKGYKQQISNSKGKIFVIDNADILLDDVVRNKIAKDSENQYIIIGRNPRGLLLNLDEIYKLVEHKVDGKIKFEIEKEFE